MWKVVDVWIALDGLHLEILVVWGFNLSNFIVLNLKSDTESHHLKEHNKVFKLNSARSAMDIEAFWRPVMFGYEIFSTF